MTKQQRWIQTKENGWTTKIQYRKSMNDITVTQSNKRLQVHRQIYIFNNEDKNVIKELKQFFKSIKIR